MIMKGAITDQARIAEMAYKGKGLHPILFKHMTNAFLNQNHILYGYIDLKPQKLKTTIAFHPHADMLCVSTDSATSGMSGYNASSKAHSSIQH
jgi:hypothetical protein